MNIQKRGRRQLRRIAHVLGLAAVFLVTTAASVPVRSAHAGGPRPAGHADFARSVERAVSLIREQAHRSPACREYFQRFGVDLDTWLAPDLPPYIIARKIDFAWRQSTQKICGGAQGRPPFELLFVDRRCFRPHQSCELASLILHEMGHLARRDTRDNEPPEFFIACRLSACVDPARYE